MLKAMSDRGGTACPVCRGNECEHRERYKGQHAIFEGRWLRRCRDCGMVFADPMPDAGEWESYNRDFFAESEVAVAAEGQAALFFQGLARLRLAQIEQAVDALPDSVLEIGPGPGHFCQAYFEQAADARYGVIETDVHCHGRLRDLGAEVWKDLGAAAAGAPYGMVVMSHVLEHCLDPRDFMETVWALLRPGGVLFVEVPCLDCDYKPTFDAHVLFFDKGSMACLLDYVGAEGCRLSYHGESIEVLRRPYQFHVRLANKVRSLVGASPAEPPAEPEPVDLPIDGAMWRAVAPFKPHVENDVPSRWLRALAYKPGQPTG